MADNSNTFNDNVSDKEPETIFDLEPDELDFLIEYRRLPPKKQRELLKRLGIE